MYGYCSWTFYCGCNWSDCSSWCDVLFEGTAEHGICCIRSKEGAEVYHRY